MNEWIIISSNYFKILYYLSNKDDVITLEQRNYLDSSQ